jgi:hypothetical protein
VGDVVKFSVVVEKWKENAESVLVEMKKHSKISSQVPVL